MTVPPQGPRTYTRPPTGKSAPEGPNLLVAGGGSESKPPQRAKQVALLPLRALPTYSVRAQVRGLPHPGEYLKLCSLQCNRHTETKKSMAQMREQIKAPEIELSNEEITNPIICRVQNTGNQDAHRNG